MSTAVTAERTVPPAPAGPRRHISSRRIVGLDVARALAVFGMFGAHVGVVADDVGSSPSTWLGVVNGRSSILFAVLAGVSIALLSGRTVPVVGDDLVRARMRILVRAAWVFAIGGALQALGTDIDVILGVYAILFVLALPFLRWSPRRLFVAAAVLAVVTPPVDLALVHFVEATDSFDKPFVTLAVTGAYPALIWWTFILVGLAVGRCDVGSTRVRIRLLAAGVGLSVLGYGGGWLTTQWWTNGTPLDGDGFSERPDVWDPVWLTGAVPHSGTTFEIVGSVGFSLVVIAVCLIFADVARTLAFPLAAVGSTALTLYSAQIIAIWVLGDDYNDNGAWGAYVLVSLVATTAWKLLLGRGPLERLLTWSSTEAARSSAPFPVSRSRRRLSPSVIRGGCRGLPGSRG
jgi:uncharacterized membrane protein YeiB